LGDLDIPVKIHLKVETGTMRQGLYLKDLPEILEIIKRTIIREKLNIKRELEPLFTPEEVKNSINIFFENFKVSDLFQEVYEIEQNRNILDKQELYLYFCDITYNKSKYPIFYIPFAINKEYNVMNIEF